MRDADRLVGPLRFRPRASCGPASGVGESRAAFGPRAEVSRSVGVASRSVVVDFAFGCVCCGAGIWRCARAGTRRSAAIRDRGRDVGGVLDHDTLFLCSQHQRHRLTRGSTRSRCSRREPFGHCDIESLRSASLYRPPPCNVSRTERAAEFRRGRNRVRISSSCGTHAVDRARRRRPLDIAGRARARGWSLALGSTLRVRGVRMKSSWRISTTTLRSCRRLGPWSRERAASPTIGRNARTRY